MDTFAKWIDNYLTVLDNYTPPVVDVSNHPDAESIIPFPGIPYWERFRILYYQNNNRPYLSYNYPEDIQRHADCTDIPKGKCYDKLANIAKCSWQEIGLGYEASPSKRPIIYLVKRVSANTGPMIPLPSLHPFALSWRWQEYKGKERDYGLVRLYTI